MEDELRKSEMSKIVWLIPLLLVLSKSDVMTNRFWFTDRSCLNIKILFLILAVDALSLSLVTFLPVPSIITSCRIKQRKQKH